MYEWDETKRAKNLANHGLDFALIEAFDWEQAIIEKDERRDYAEERYRALGYIGDPPACRRFYDPPRKHPPNQPAKGQQKRGAKMVSKVTPPTKTEDNRINRGIETDPDNPEWTREDFARARPAKDVLPPDLYQAAVKRYRGQRGPQKAPVKQDIKLRIDPDILASFKATGPGWQSRMNDALRRALPGLTASRKNPKADPSRKVRSPTKH
jgi:uncharacterized protein (DUF4415 family)